MSVSIRFVDGPLEPLRGANGGAGGGAGAGAGGGAIGEAGDCAACGAHLIFEGLVRPIEDGRPIDALLYEAYRPMADRELERLARETMERFQLAVVEVTHSVGRVPVGACSFRLELRCEHRQEALAAAAHFIDSMKRDAPIWKRPEWSPVVIPRQGATP